MEDIGSGPVGFHKRLFEEASSPPKFVLADCGLRHRLLRARSSTVEYFVRVPAQIAKAHPRFGLPIAPAQETGAHRNARLINLLKRAFAVRDRVNARRDCSLVELARMGGMTPSHFSRLLRLNYLAPDIQTAILDGTQPPDLSLQKLLYSALPLDWRLQRRVLGFAEAECWGA